MLPPISVPGVEHPLRHSLRAKLADHQENPTPGSAVRILITRAILARTEGEIDHPALLASARGCQGFCEEIFDGAWMDIHKLVTDFS